MFTRRALAVAALLCAAALAGCGEGSSSSTTGGRPPLPTPTPVGLETPPPGTAYLGAYSAGGVAGLENAIGRKLALDMHYYTWAGLFPSFQETGDLSNGRTSVDSWDCQPSNAQIAAGNDDQLIVTRAQAIKTYGHPIFLRYMWDANLPPAGLGRSQCYDKATDNADGTFSGAEYVAAWQHIRKIFAQQGVTNVIWVWSFSSAGVNPAPYYPGASQVDWVGIDAYDTTGSDFATTLSAPYAQAAAFGKPILISETGASQLIQPSYLSGVVPALQSQFPMVKGFMYYSASAGSFVWTLNSAGIAAFATLGADPYFNAFTTP